MEIRVRNTDTHLEFFLVHNHFPFFEMYSQRNLSFVLYSTRHLRPLDSSVSDAEIEPRTVATIAFAVRRSNHTARANFENSA